jgi:hypothetical protein
VLVPERLVAVTEAEPAATAVAGAT